MTDTKQSSPTHVVVVGGGFGGVKTALELCDNPSVHVTLVSERSDMYYFPTLYHTATGGADEESSIPLEQIFAGKPVTIKIGRANTVNHEQKILGIEGQSSIIYDIVVFALGVVTNYFNIPGLKEYAYGIKTVPDAERLKRHLHAQLLAGKPDMNYIVVGGGPTGIELAGALSFYLREIVKKHGITHRVPHIDLVEAQTSLMPRLPKKVGRSIARRLRKLGVKLHLNSRVEGANAEELLVSGKALRSHTIIWTAGVANNPFFTNNDFTLSPRSKVQVDEFLRPVGKTDIYIIGDNAETPYSGMAQTALYDGEFVAHNIQKQLAGDPKLAYRPKEPIYITPVGKNWASVEWGRWYFDGWLGWLLRGAADLRGFLDIQPIPEAAEQWSRMFDQEDLCPVCGFSSAPD